MREVPPEKEKPSRSPRNVNTAASITPKHGSFDYADALMRRLRVFFRTAADPEPGFQAGQDPKEETNRT
jgi:hypothetical protein